tara:strand:+ start:33469 stop:35433 length:1965 start_codon:yes stop_codon:yes gene_type:complete
MASNPILDRAIAGANAAVMSAGPAPAPTNEQVAANPLESQLAAVEAALGKQQQVVADFVESEEEAVGKDQTLTDLMQSAMVDAAKAKQDIALVEGNAAMKAQNATIDAITAIGGSDAMVANMAQLDEEGTRLSDLLDKQTDIMNDEFTGIGIIDSVINGFRNISTQDQIASVTAERDNTARQMQLETAATETANRQAILSKKTITDSTIKANSEFIANSAAQDVYKAELSGVRSNSERMRSLVGANQQQLANTIQVADQANTEQSMQLSRERMVIARAELEQQAKMMPLQLRNLEIAVANAELNVAKNANSTPAQQAAAISTWEKTVLDNNTLINANKRMAEDVAIGRAGMGLPPQTEEERIKGLNNPVTIKASLDFAEMGNAQRSTGKFQLADNPYDAQVRRNELDPQGLAASNRGYELLDDVESKVEAEIATIVAAGGKAPKTAEAQKDLYNTVAAATMKGHAASISEGNPLHAAPFGVLVENYAEIARTPLYQKVLGPNGANVNVTDAKQIRKLGIAAVRAKLISAEEYVAGMETIFDSAVVYNNESEGGFARVGLPNQVDYKVQVPVAPSELSTFLNMAQSAVLAPMDAVGMLTSISDKGSVDAAGKLAAKSLMGLSKFKSVDFTDSAAIKIDLAKELSTMQKTAPQESN